MGHVKLGLFIGCGKGRSSGQLRTQGWTVRARAIHLELMSVHMVMAFITPGRVTWVVTLPRKEKNSNKKRRIQTKDSNLLVN